MIQLLDTEITKNLEFWIEYWQSVTNLQLHVLRDLSHVLNKYTYGYRPAFTKVGEIKPLY